MARIESTRLAGPRNSERGPIACRYGKRSRALVQNLRLHQRELEVQSQRIGQDLHDGLDQHLHGLSYLAALLDAGLREDGSARVPAVLKLNQYLTEALDLTRSFAHGLQPVAPAPEGLMLALQNLVDRTNRLYGVRGRCRCDGPVLLEAHNVATHLYRIAQEAVTNAMKHGQTTRLQITLSAAAGRLALVVRDNGRGIGRASPRARGMGLHIRRYRADAIAGVWRCADTREGAPRSLAQGRRQSWHGMGF